MSVYCTLTVLSFWIATALSQTAPTRTVSAMISAASPTPALQQCDSICTLMAYPIPGAGSSLFASYCEGTKRTDCGVNNMQFQIDLVGAGGQTLSFKCTCDLPPTGTASASPSSESPITSSPSKTADTTTASLGITSTASSSLSSLPSSTLSSGSSPASSSITPSPSSANSQSSTATPTTLATSTNTLVKTPTPTVSPTGKPAEPNPKTKSTALPDTAGDKATPGTIIGIVVGVLCILACLGAGALAIYRRRQKKKIDQGYIDSFRSCSAIPGSV